MKEKKKNFEKVGDRLKGQLRSIIGSLAWLARVCRPDLSYSVCKLQSCVHSPTYEDVKYANNVVRIAQQTKGHGITYPRKAFVFEGALVVGIQDASHAADYDLSGSGEKLGFRSQSGRLLCLAHRDSQQSKCGALMLLECHSTVIKRVCRSTLQSETLSLLAGAEESDHLRFILHGMTHPYKAGSEQWMIEAQDSVNVEWFTDCRSLADHLVQAGLTVVADKRLAIDLCGLRQVIWRQPGEMHGDPLLTDHVPPNATTKITWTTTDRMLADPLTKSMKPKGLLDLMKGCKIDMAPTKFNGRETEVS